MARKQVRTERELHELRRQLAERRQLDMLDERPAGVERADRAQERIA
jgi:hypothetical protein